MTALNTVGFRPRFLCIFEAVTDESFGKQYPKMAAMTGSIAIAAMNTYITPSSLPTAVNCSTAKSRSSLL